MNDGAAGGATMPAGIDRGLAVLAVALVREIAASAALNEAAGLLEALGARIADAHPVAPAPTVAVLQQRLSAHLATLGWGECALDPTDRSLEVVHRDWPRPADPAAAADWRAAFPIVLAAVYRRWFAMLGAPAALGVSIVTVDPDAIRLRQQ